MTEEQTKRCLSKTFLCTDCHHQFTKLVNFTVTETECPKCNKISHENNINFTSSDEKLRKHILSMVTPFSVSPFCESVTRSHHDFSEILEHNLISTPTEEFFYDNYASNFISNFIQPMSRVVFVQSQQGNENTSPPLSKKQMKKIRKLILKELHCKKNNDKVELPNCFLCLKDIPLGTTAALLRCGHLFHEDCIDKWLDKHSVCSICNYETIPQKNHKSSIDVAIETEKDEDIPILPEKKTEKKNEEKDNSKDNLAKETEEKNSNINMLGETNGNLI